MTIRRCLACHSKARAVDLIPLHLVEGGSIRVGRPHRGRGGWIHPECIHAAIARPSAFNRCFRSRAHGVVELPQHIESWMIATLHRQLHNVFKDGLVSKKSAEPHDNVALTIRSSEHPDSHDSFENKSIYSASPDVFSIKSVILDQIVDRSQCLELKINAGRSTQSLLRSLRAWDRLG